MNEMVAFRILVQHLDQFRSQSKEVPLHIQSTYTAEMSIHSEVVRIYN